MDAQNSIIIQPFGVFRAVLLEHTPEDLARGDLTKGRMVLDETRHNLVTQTGLNGWAKIVNQESGFSGVINYCALGTGANAPQLSDTTLQTEVARTTMEVGSNVRTNNSVAMSFYFGPTVANGNIKEIGAFVGGTATTDSGTLFDRALFDIVKTNLNSLFIYFTITFAAS